MSFEMLRRGMEIDAATAQESRLVNQVFSDDSFEVEVSAYANQFEKLSRTAVSLTKTLLSRLTA